ncbi:hypothetical protein H072_10013 [Dactylellina haptotyla CBS 200.50]|uniref:Wax synthase domain-containing protein n=1 Tax=Dactylellina haptotyla (strain CBS 200.50) TaxID=1284197 RepID=S8A191_DACHA|nr:hypothetical protein H072_10013 [Dactylellina haptotyla CBS 200.50]
MAPPSGTTFVNWNFCNSNVLLFVPAYILTIIFAGTLVISTPKNSFTRYASLPILAYLCTFVFRHGWNAFPLNTTGMCDWALSTFNAFLLFTTVICLEGVDETNAVISKPHNRHPPGYFVRLWRAMSYCVNMRAIQTPHQIKNVPAFDSKRPGWVPSRRRFLITNTAWFLALYLLQDMLYSQEMAVEDEAKLFGTYRENLIRRDPKDGPVTGDEIGGRIGFGLVMWSILVPLAVSLMYTFLSIVAVGTGISSPKNWPPVFGSPKDSYTLRLYWGKFWHQTLRWHFTKPAQFITHGILRLPKNGLVQRYVNIYLVFALSGLMHANQSYFMFSSPGYKGNFNPSEAWVREIIFFAIVPTCIMIEDGVQWLFRSQKVRSGEEKEGFVLWKRVVGYLWTWGIMILFTPIIDYPKFRARLPTFLPFHPLVILGSPK